MADKIILLIDSDPAQAETLAAFFSRQGFQVKTAADGLEGMALWQMVRPDLVISSMNLPRADGLDILDFRHREFQHVPLIFLTDVTSAVQGKIALVQGAYDVITKPVSMKPLLDSAGQALQHRQTEGCTEDCRVLPADLMIGSSPVMKNIVRDLDLIASSNRYMLITGEPGTGKSLLVRHICTRSTCHAAPCITIHCPALKAAELEEVLPDALQRAADGLLYLREVSALPLPLQKQLYHILETGTPEGDQEASRVQPRIIASSCRDLQAMARNELFHAGLYARLQAIHFHLQPLRERGKDILELMDYFLAHFSDQHGRPAPPFSAQAMKLFLRYPWPGNVGELRHIIERIILTCAGSTVTEEALPEKMRNRGKKRAKPIKLPSLPEEEKLHILATLEEAGWNQSESARRLGMTRNTLRYRMKKYKIKARPRQRTHA